MNMGEYSYIKKFSK